MEYIDVLIDEFLQDLDMELKHPTGELEGINKRLDKLEEEPTKGFSNDPTTSKDRIAKLRNRLEPRLQELITEERPQHEIAYYQRVPATVKTGNEKGGRSRRIEKPAVGANPTMSGLDVTVSNDWASA